MANEPAIIRTGTWHIISVNARWWSHYELMHFRIHWLEYVMV